MEQSSWLTEKTKGKIEDLQRKFGFEEQEAVAFWHVRRAELMMSALRADDVRKRREIEKEDDQDLGGFERLAVAIDRKSKD